MKEASPNREKTAAVTSDITRVHCTCTSTRQDRLCPWYEATTTHPPVLDAIVVTEVWRACRLYQNLRLKGCSVWRTKPLLGNFRFPLLVSKMLYNYYQDIMHNVDYKEMPSYIVFINKDFVKNQSVLSCCHFKNQSAFLPD